MVGSSYERSADKIPAEYFWPGGSGGGGGYNSGAYATSTLATTSGGGIGIGAGSGAGVFGGGGVLADGRNSFTEGLAGIGGGGALMAGSAGTGKKVGMGTVVTGFVAAGQPISPIDRNLTRGTRSVSPLTLGGGGSGGAGVVGGAWAGAGVQVIFIF